MNKTIYYFSGTGNSLKIAKDISLALQYCEVVSISNAIMEVHKLKPKGIVGFVFPEYYYGLPQLVVEFLNAISLSDATYTFAVATYAKSAGGCLSQITKLLKSKGKKLNSGFYVKMVDNFILWTWDVPPIDQHSLIHEQAQKHSVRIANSVNNSLEIIDNSSLEILGPILFGYSRFLKQVNTSDKAFFAAPTCNSCQICVNVCPTQNIVIENKKPKWQSQKCQKCLACLHLCPQKALQYGKTTMKRSRYKNPYISLKELMLRP